MYAMRTGHEKEMRCLSEIIVVGSVDSETIGCLASKVVLYASVSFLLPFFLFLFSLLDVS